MKERIKSYLSITKKEWNGMVVLVILIALVTAAPYVSQLFRKDNTINFKEFDKAAAQLNKAGNNTGDAPEGDNAGQSKKGPPPVMVPFDPNNLTTARWQQLGLSEQQAKIIKHYEEKGGRFNVKEDLKRIYTITPADYQRLEPYINIREAAPLSKATRPNEIIELNTADAAKLITLKGIGPAFAAQIIRYRERLGGFTHKDQLKEVFGIDSSTYQQIKSQVSADPQKIKQININTVSFDQLRLFPYLSYKQVNAVIEYRKQHGSYMSVADMKNIVLLDEGILRKIEPYLSFK
jgi:competence protein ComEA